MFKDIEKAIKDKNYTMALSKLNKLTGDILNTSKYIKLLAHVAYRCGDFKLAEEIYNTVFNKKIQDTRSYLEYSSILVNNQDSLKAKKYLEEALLLYPEHIPIMKALVNIIKKDKDLDYQLILSEKLLSLDSNNKSSYKLLIDTLLSCKDYKQSKKRIDEAIFLFGEDEFLLENIKYFTAIKEFEIVLDTYSKLQKIDPTNYIIYIGQLRTLDALHKFEEAEKYLLCGLEVVDNKNKILHAIVNYYTRLENFNKAIYYSEILIENDNLNIENYKKLSEILNKTQDFQKSICILNNAEKTIELSKNDKFVIHSARGNIYFNMHHYKVALAEFDSALDIKPYDLEVNLQFGITKMKLLHFARAKKIFENILEEKSNFKKARTYLIAVDREEKSNNLKIERYKRLSLLTPYTDSDYYAYIDMQTELQHIDKMILICKERLRVNKEDTKVISRLVILLLYNVNNLEAIDYWNNLIVKDDVDLELLYLIRASEKYAFSDKDISKLRIKSMNKIKDNFSTIKKTFNITDIAILGGSNSIMTDGWTPTFKSHMSQYSNIKVDNFGLGGISSLYGLFIAKEKKLFQKYDTIIFEYTLNDIYFDYIKGYDYDLLKAVLHSLISEAVEYGTHIIFILMSPLDNLNNINCSIAKIYTDVASAYSNAHIFDVNKLIKSDQYSASDFINMLYKDNMHYTSSFARYMADTLVLNLFDNTFIESKSVNDSISKSIDSTLNLRNLKLLRPETYRIEGPSTYIFRETKIISENFLCIYSGTNIQIKIPKGKRVLALLINSSENTGYIKIKYGGDVFIKNIFAERPINDTVKARVYLKQFTKVLVNNNSEDLLELSVDVSDSDFQNMEKDITVYQQNPKVRLSSQELEIAGVLIA